VRSSLLPWLHGLHFRSDAIRATDDRHPDPPMHELWRRGGVLDALLVRVKASACWSLSMVFNMQQRQKPVLFLMVGLPGAGKTTRAKEIQIQRHALRLTPDDWILALYGNRLDRKQRDSVREPVEALQWEIAQQVLALGTNVILDWGLWARVERDQYRREAAALGADARLIFTDASIEELWRRVSQREESKLGTLAITREELEAWVELFEPPTPDEMQDEPN